MSIFATIVVRSSKPYGHSHARTTPSLVKVAIASRPTARSQPHLPIVGDVWLLADPIQVDVAVVPGDPVPHVGTDGLVLELFPLLMEGVEMGTHPYLASSNSRNNIHSPLRSSLFFTTRS